MRTKNNFKGVLFHSTADERARILVSLQEVVGAEPDILFAYVYGSFVEDRPYHDIDVGIYLASARRRENRWLDMEVAPKLEQAVAQAGFPGLPASPHNSRPGQRERIPIDVRVLNDAPPSFCYHVVRGRLLFSRDEAGRVPWAAQIVSHYLDLKPLRHAALKEAMLSWGSTET